MRVASIIKDDVQNSDEGITTSIWISGCPHHCEGCHNQKLWDYNIGSEIEANSFSELLIDCLTSNGIKRNLSVLGGEPLDKVNLDDLEIILKKVKEVLPDTKVYLWTGYTFKEIKKLKLFSYIDVLIDGRFEKDKKDLSLHLRGSSNQKIYRKNPKTRRFKLWQK